MGLGQQRLRGPACGSTVPRREGRRESIGSSDASSGAAAAVQHSGDWSLLTMNGVEPPLPSSVLLLPASDECRRQPAQQQGDQEQVGTGPTT
jgi:erythromycin esterase-like protein